MSFSITGFTRLFDNLKVKNNNSTLYFIKDSDNFTYFLFFS